MGKPGAKKTDQIVSLTPGDVHIIMIPSPGGPVPTPIPHPCASMIKDKVATKVKVMGQPGAVKGSKSKHTPPHIPMGPGPFQKPPKNEGEIITGSANVFYEGKEAAMLGDTGQMCSDPSDTPVGKVIGTAATVLIGGGGGGSDEAREQASAAAMKAATAACHKWINANMPPGAEREQAHRDLCTATGHPVDVATGKLFTKNIDLQISGRIPFEFARNYSSARSDFGVFGCSWRHSYEMQLIVHQDFVAHRDANGRFIEFVPIEVGEKCRNQPGRLTLSRQADGYVVESPGGLKQFFRYAAEPGRSALLVPLHHIADRYSNRIQFEYDKGRLTRITDSAGRLILLEYNERGFVKELRLRADPVVQQEVRVRSYGYSADNDLVEVTDALGHALGFEYAGHLLVKETDRNGFSFYFNYDRDGWCLETWGDGGILRRHLSYDKTRRQTRVVDSFGHSITYDWNEFGVVTKESNWHDFAWRFAYNEALDVVRIMDPVGNTWTYDYDDRGRLCGAENPEGHAVAYAWDAQNRPVAYTDPAGQQHVREYDDTHEARSVDPAGNITVEVCNERGDLIKVIHPDRRETRLEYDAAGNLATIIEPSGLKIIRRYNAVGDLLHESDPLGPRLEVEYDALRRPSRLWRREKGATKFERDREGRLVSKLEPDGQATAFEYTQFDRLRRVTRTQADRLHGGHPTQPARSYTYDTENRVIKVETLGGEKSVIHYDGCDRPMRVEYPDGRTQKYERDGRGFITELWENGSKIFEQTSDSYGRVLRRVTGNGVVHTFDYDPLGRLAKADRSDVAGSVEIERDLLGRRVAETGALGRQGLDYGDDHDVAYSWNDELALTMGVEFTGSGAAWSAVRNGRTDLGLEFDLHDRLARVKFASGEVHELAYHGNARLETRRIMSPNGGVIRHDFQYDDKGRLTRFLVDGVVARSYERDGLGRLVGMVSGAGAAERRFSWNFDPAGNRVLATDPQGVTYQNRYGRGHRPLQIGDASLDYDQRGRVISQIKADGQNTRFEWDVLGRLTKVTLPDGQTVEMGYDALGRRMEKTTAAGTTRFGWVGNQLVHEVRPDGEQRHYFYLPDSSRPLACYILRPGESWRVHALLDDLVGCPLQMTDEQGGVVWQAEFAPWGEAMAMLVEQQDQPLRMPGQYQDQETGLHYNYARYYLPRAGAYLSPDPAGFDGGDDPYSYVADPVCWSDPMGLSADDYTAKLGLGLKSKSKDLDYNAWSKEKGFQTYSELSGRGSFNEQINQAMTAADEIHFNLKGVDPAKANGQLNDYDEPAAGYTNYELHLIKTNPEYRDKVIWHDENGKEMPKGWMPPGF